jgi:hypothetical protein
VELNPIVHAECAAWENDDIPPGHSFAGFVALPKELKSCCSGHNAFAVTPKDAGTVLHSGCGFVHVSRVEVCLGVLAFAECLLEKLGPVEAVKLIPFKVSGELVEDVVGDAGLADALEVVGVSAGGFDELLEEFMAERIAGS